MATVFTPFERLVLRALMAILLGSSGYRSVAQEIDLAIRTSDGQQRANEANKAIVP